VARRAGRILKYDDGDGSMRPSDPASSAHIDLEACAREPIHIPGAIQPHGCLLAFDADSRLVRQASANVDAFLGADPAALLSKPIDAALPAGLLPGLLDALAEGTATATLEFQVAGRRLEGRLHQHDGMAILEVEPAEGEGFSTRSSLLDRGLRRLSHLDDLDSLMNAAVEVVRDLSGFDRVVAYRFDEDDHGEVIAEARSAGMDPYLRLHFPESDIPRQARELYRRNWIRIIPDARYDPVPLVAAPGGGQPLDLTHASLRSVSPVHLEYLANMGLQASMSVSLLVDGRLWGLISCGHRTPLAIPSRLRGACETIGRFISLQVGALQTLELERRKAARAGAMRALGAVLAAAAEHGLAGLQVEKSALLEVADAAGAAVVVDDAVTTIGDAPDAATAGEISRWVAERAGPSGLWATRQLPAEDGRWSQCAAVASGVLAIVLPTPLHSCVLWFRPELVHTVDWGGNPNDPPAPPAGMASPSTAASGTDTRHALGLHPRRSFELWKEVVRGRSLPWTRADLDCAAELRRSAIETDLSRQVQRAEAAVRARDELVAVVAHDLRTPMSVVVMQSAIIQRLLLGMDATADTAQRLRASAQVVQRAGERMASLLKDLLDLARIEAGRFDVAPVRKSVAQVLEEAQELLQPVCESKRQALVIHPTPGLTVQADPERLFQVLSNLIGNASKFAPEHSDIEVRAVGTSEGLCEFSITDRGPGIPPEKRARIFERYWKETAARGGAGLGLYIARGIVEAHGGTIRVDSRVGEGTTMRFTIPLA
jgi:light-regulated signal transduction histidine kinase (bacteriophytochrome)